MLFPAAILVVILPLCLSKPAEVTFKNVTFRGYSISTEKFKRTIPSSNRLKDFLPKSAYDKIEFVEQNIPVLYENSLADLGDLDELVIEYCEVSEIKPGALKNVPGLRKLSLKGNKLKEIKEGVFNNLNIWFLRLSMNLITTIEDGAFDNLPQILYIELDHNKIGQWDKNWFYNTPLLFNILMQHNSLTKLPNKAFQNLAGNERRFAISLLLSDNKIKVIEPQAFQGLTKIDFLWLDNNQLEDFDNDLLEGIDIKELMLDNNNIHCLQGDLAKIIKAEVTSLNLNPLDSDCLNKIKTWAEKNGKNVDISFESLSNYNMKQTKTNTLTMEKRLKGTGNQENEQR